MTVPWDAVVSVHAHPATCGVTKFNLRLAREMGVPHVTLCVAPWSPHPLISFKSTEWPTHDLPGLMLPRVFSVWLHDVPPADLTWWTTAAGVYAANPAIADAIRPIRPDVRSLWCPSTLQPRVSRVPGLQVLTFGMAGKLVMPHYHRLKQLLDARRRPYTVSRSAAVHEGSPWEDVTVGTDALRAGFGSSFVALGYLLDDGLAQALAQADLVALFYDPPVRANNTTLWAALDAGCPVITTVDGYSPPELVHGETVLDLARTTTLPTSESLGAMGCRGQQAANSRGWAPLIGALTGNR